MDGSDTSLSPDVKDIYLECIIHIWCFTKNKQPSQSEYWCKAYKMKGKDTRVETVWLLATHI